MTPAALELHDLDAGYSGVAVVRGVTLAVAPGEVVALLGPNGVGKTTLVRTIAGLLPPVNGSVSLGTSSEPGPLHRRIRSGMALVMEGQNVFGRLTVHENLRLGRGSPDTATGIFPELAPLLTRTARLLSGGEQQILTVARALAADPTVLVADEISLGLAPQVVTRLLSAIRAAADDRGLGALVVEQHVERALAVADRAIVLHRGSVALQGTAAEVRSRIGDVEKSYLAYLGADEHPSPETANRKGNLST